MLVGCYSGEISPKRGSDERMKNALITITTGLAAQQIYGNSTINAYVDRPLEFDSELIGTTSSDEIMVRMKIPTGDNVFHAVRTSTRWKGSQDKNMFDWGVNQTDADTYEIDRVGFNGTLHLHVTGRNIRGRYDRPWALDYLFDGKIEENGTYRLNFHTPPIEFDWTVRGTIKKK
jgi:hypothetical protein